MTSPIRSAGSSSRERRSPEWYESDVAIASADATAKQDKVRNAAPETIPQLLSHSAFPEVFPEDWCGAWRQKPLAKPAGRVGKTPSSGSRSRPSQTQA